MDYLDGFELITQILNIGRGRHKSQLETCKMKDSQKKLEVRERLYPVLLSLKMEKGVH